MINFVVRTDQKMDTIILGIESSCDDTSAAVIRNGLLLSNITAGQKVHEAYGGVVPELASREHQQNIVPVVSEALRQAGVTVGELSAIAYTLGPGLLGSLHVGTAFAKGMAVGLDIPLVEVNHLHGHVLSHFIKETEADITPKFPFLCLLVSGGNSQIIKVNSPFEMEILGKTIDDAAGEAFDKCAKLMGLPYPGGPHIDRLSKLGNPKRFKFSKPHLEGYDYSFSGLKTSFLYTLRDNLKVDPDYVKNNIEDLAASLQTTIIDILIDKLRKAITATGVKDVAIGGGVSANSEFRDSIQSLCDELGVKAWIPAKKFTTDNAAMVAMAGYFKLQNRDYGKLDSAPFARVEI